MTDTETLINSLRSHAPVAAEMGALHLADNLNRAANLIQIQAARIMELESTDDGIIREWIPPDSWS